NLIGTNELVAPYFLFGSISLEKRFRSGMEWTITTDLNHGVHELRASNLVPGVSPPTMLVASAGSANEKSVSFHFRSPSLRLLKLRTRAIGKYSVGRSNDDNVTLSGGTDWKSRWGQTDLFPYHAIWAGGIIEAPSQIRVSLLVLANS